MRWSDQENSCVHNRSLFAPQSCSHLVKPVTLKHYGICRHTPPFSAKEKREFSQMQDGKEHQATFLTANLVASTCTDISACFDSTKQYIPKRNTLALRTNKSNTFYYVALTHREVEQIYLSSCGFIHSWLRFLLLCNQLTIIFGRSVCITLFTLFMLDKLLRV